jgi:hypothetical protein
LFSSFEPFSQVFGLVFGLRGGDFRALELHLLVRLRGPNGASAHSKKRVPRVPRRHDKILGFNNTCRYWGSEVGCYTDAIVYMGFFQICIKHRTGRRLPTTSCDGRRYVVVGFGFHNY